MAKTMTQSNTQDLQLDFPRMQKLIETSINTQEPLMIWGASGIGKSDLVHQVAAKLARPVIDIRLSMYESVEIKGYPTLGTDEQGREILKFIMSERMPRNADDESVIFFDEINAAMTTTLHAMYQLILDRKVDAYALPAKTVMIAAGNRDSDKGGTFAMPKPLENRFMHAELVPSCEAWMDWALDRGINTEVLGYINKNNSNLNTFNPATSSRGYATSRSWAKFSKVLDHLYATGTPTDDDIRVAASACIGVPIASEFMAFRKIINKIPDTQDILDGKAPKLQDKNVDVVFVVIHNAMFKLRELNYKTNASIKQATWDAYMENFLGYLLKNQDKIGAEYFSLALNSILNKYELPLKFIASPNFQEMVKIVEPMQSIRFNLNGMGRS